MPSRPVFLTVWGLLPDATADWQETVLLGREVSADAVPHILAQCRTLAERDGIRNMRHVIETAPSVPDFGACVRSIA